MVADLHREETLLVVLSTAGIALDAESIAATYGSAVVEWRRSLHRLERKGLVVVVDDGLYVLTPEGRDRVRSRGPSGGTIPVDGASAP